MRRPNRFWLAWLSALASGCLAASAGTPGPDWFARVWQAEEGLTDNSVTGIAQSSRGYLLVSTQTGWARFDGVRFQMLEVPLPPGRSRPMIRGILAGAAGEVWLALEGGLLVSTGAARTSVFTSADGLPGFRPLSLVQTGDGSVWVSYSDGSACRVAGGQVTRYTARHGLSGVGGCSLATDAQGQLWFAKAGRVGTFNGTFTTLHNFPETAMRVGGARTGGVWVCAGNQLFRVQSAGALEFRSRIDADPLEPRVVYEDNSGAVWIGTSGTGLFRCVGTNMVKIETSHREIDCIYQDHESSIWVGTGGGGLNRLRPAVVHLQTVSSGLPFEKTRSICEDDTGTLWAIGANGVLARGQGARWESVSTGIASPGARATTVCPGPGSSLWVGTYRGGLYCRTNGAFVAVGRREGLAGETVRALMTDAAGGLWIGLESGVCVQNLTSNGFRNFNVPAAQPVRALAQDTRGTIWMGTTDGFLLRVDGEGVVNETSRTLPSPKPIRCLLAGPDGSLWIGYANAGLGRLKDGRFVRFGREQGLQDTYVCSIQADTYGSLWFAAERGLHQVAVGELEAVAGGIKQQVWPGVYSRGHGSSSLQGSYGYAPGSWRARDGRLLFAMQSGVAVVRPERARQERVPAAAAIERVLLDSREVRVSDGNLVLPAGTRRLEIHFTCLSFIAPEEIRFRHQLSGWDENWVEGGTTRSASYTRLPPGDYSFSVAACNVGCLWGAHATLKIIVEPRLWQKSWFRFLLGSGTLLGLGWVIRSHSQRKLRQRIAVLERQSAVDRERARIARDIHDEVGAGLAQIGLLADLGTVDGADGERARGALSKIAERARGAVSALDEIVWSANPANDLLPRLADYLCRMADDCFESAPMRCRKEVPTGLPAVPVRAEVRHQLVLAVKEAFTNCLKHSGADTVWLRLEFREPELIVTVEDNGTGFSPGNARPGRNGLINLSVRMEEVGARSVLRSAPGQGTRVEFHVRIVPELKDL